MRDASTSLELPLEFLNAKLRGRRRTVFEGDRLRELERSSDVEELARRIFPRETIAGRLGLERRLRQRCISELTFFLGYAPAQVGRFYAALVRRYQIESILVLLRLFYGGREEPEPEQYVPDLPASLSVPAGELLSSSDLKEFFGRLPGDLSDAAARTLELCQGTRATGLAEMALERVYWKGVTEACAALPPTWRGECSPPVLWELDTARLLGVLRAGRSYDIEWEQLQSLLPRRGSLREARGGLALSDALLKQLHSDPSAERIVAAVPPLRGVEAGEDLVELEDLLWRRLFRLAERLFYGVLEGPAILVSYYYLRRNELRVLTALAERLHWGRREKAPR